MTRLLTLDEAAERVGVPKRGLRIEAERRGLLVKIGRAVRIDPNDLEELVKKCRVKPQEQDCTAAPTSAALEPTKSATADDASTRALATADRLRKLSRDTSRNETGPPPAPVILLK